MNSLVSIIIPTYDRAHLIGETLDSIINQTYQNWECIIVDDGSTDKSEELINKYIKLDRRFRYFQRPPNRAKGANSCRNLGLENAIGEYVIFFDSDDLMIENHISFKLGGFISNNLDYVITRTKFFNSDLDYMESYYRFDRFEITPFNYISQKINWLTLDICLKTTLAKKLKFNENLHSGQEYNYFSKLILASSNALFINEVVSLRRYHENSIRAKLKTKHDFNLGYFRSNWFTYLDVRSAADKSIRLLLLKRCIDLIYEEKKILINGKFLFITSVFKEFKFKGVYLIIMIFSLNIFNKGHLFKKCLIKGIK